MSTTINEDDSFMLISKNKITIIDDLKTPARLSFTQNPFGSPKFFKKSANSTPNAAALQEYNQKYSENIPFSTRSTMSSTRSGSHDEYDARHFKYDELKTEFDSNPYQFHLPVINSDFNSYNSNTYKSKRPSSVFTTLHKTGPTVDELTEVVEENVNEINDQDDIIEIKSIADLDRSFQLNSDPLILRNPHTNSSQERKLNVARTNSGPVFSQHELNSNAKVTFMLSESVKLPSKNEYENYLHLNSNIILPDSTTNRKNISVASTPSSAIGPNLKNLFSCRNANKNRKSFVDDVSQEKIKLSFRKNNKTFEIYKYSNSSNSKSSLSGPTLSNINDVSTVSVVNLGKRK